MDIGSCYLDGNADAVEFCPHEPFQHFLAAATYTLQDTSPPSRSGTISLFSVDSDVPNTDGNGGLQLLHCINTIGVFDVKWNHRGSLSTPPLLAQADADGSLSLYTLQPSGRTTDHDGPALRELCSEKISTAMCLYVDWNSSSCSLSLGLSDGSVSVVSFREAQLQILQSWPAHEYEVWTTSFNTYQPQLLYTGSDDCRFCCWDLRENPSTLVFQNKNSHQMGVCSIAQNPMNSNMLLTGSYDEYLRVWDIRSTVKPVSKTSLCLGGGVWRIKYHPIMPDVVLAACMHNGFAIVRVEEETATVVESYEKHESLAYGADWQRAECQEDRRGRGSLVATCSFYDRLLRIWKPKILDIN